MCTKFFKAILKNEKGSAIIMVIMATIGLSVLSLVLIQRKKTEAIMAIKNTADKEIDSVIFKIGSLLAAPAHCNANFVGAVNAGPLTTLYSCNTGFICRPSNATRTAVMGNNATTWELLQGSNIPSRIRIVSMNYATTAQTITPITPGILTLTVVFEKNMGNINSATRITRVTKTFETYVVNGLFDYGTNVLTLNPGLSITGCTKAPQTTIVY
ncbi:MAG: hypothetical protein Q7U04_05600 [Bacteriovorax sp.]|nr:hypothetical protein [Bacteriovorax sp.]